MDILTLIKLYKLYITIAVLILGLIFVYMYFRKGTENLVNVALDDKVESHNLDVKQNEIPVEPTEYDAGSGTIMSGPEFIPSQFLSPWYQAYTGNLKNQYLLDDGEGGTMGLNFNMCSKSCCSDQYPVPFKMPIDSNVCDSKDEFVPTNYSCNNAWQDSGCVCMTKKQANFLGNRGNNA
jgi:hypothetical protein